MSLSLSLGPRQAAPMQNRLAPLSLAARAAATTSSSAIRFWVSRSVEYRLDCEQ